VIFPKTLLVVEDDEGLADLYMDSLREIPVPCKWLRTGAETQAFVHGNPACLLLLDYSLPDMNATELVQSMARSGTVPPFIVITGHGGERVAVDMMKLGALDYLIKDGGILDRLPQAVERVLRDFRMREEMAALERSSQENARELAAVYEHSPTAMMLLGDDLRIKRANPAARRLLPHDGAMADLGFGDLLDCFHARNENLGCGTTASCMGCSLRRILTETLALNKPFVQVELEITHCQAGRPGKSYFLISTAPVMMGSQPTVLVCLEDISQRKAGEAALRAEEERLRRAILEAPIPVMICDQSGRILQISRGWIRYSGYSQEAAPNFTRWLELVLELSEEQAGRRLTELLSMGAATLPQTWDIRSRDSGVRNWEVQITPLEPTQSSQRLFLMMAVDMTDRRQAEVQLLRSQRMESVGRLASGIAHDLNNVLSPILMALPMLRDAVDDPQIKGLADAAERSARRGAGIIRQVLTFGRGLEGQRGPVQLQRLVKEMGQIISETFPKTIRLETHIDAGVSPILGDVTQLHQVLMNLCINARDAMPKGGTLTLRLEKLELRTVRAGVIGRLDPGCYARLTVRDTGVGIAPENLDRIFDPFFTTKDITQGTGLGLSTVLGIVKAHDGIINLNSEPGKGASFEVLLPVVPEAMAELAPVGDHAPGTGRGAGEVILIVDDEEGVCKIARQILEQNGYSVICAADGQEALDLLERNASAIRLAVIDLLMPRMDGLALAVALRRILPRIPLVLSSGVGENANETQEAELREVGFDRRLAKPYSAEVLLSTVSQLLSQRR
jgi:PAS domain S-box-containing protein